MCDCLIDNPFRRVPVTEDGKLAGVSSRSDVIRAILRLKRQEIAN
ncbi:MAG: CBS domain-containing protein [Planctomycetes bacterium]|nr:CBS domain-containing protein [Planctomycetota bacterium]